MDKAEKTIESWKERRERMKRKWLVPLVYVEWRCEQLSKLLEQWAFLDILEHVGRLLILVAVISYVKGCTERGEQAENQKKAKQYQAWQVINLAQGKSGSGGRKKALEELRKDNVSLVGVDVSKAHLPELKLENTNLWRANFAEAYLGDANLTEARLVKVNFAKAILENANLTNAKLVDANFAGAELIGTNLTDANLVSANLTDANIVNANLAKADLSYANLTGAKLPDANLARANLRGTNLMDIEDWRSIKSIEYANIYGVENAPEGFREWATMKTNGALEIESRGEWQNYIRTKMEEKKQQEAESNRGDQKKTGEK